MEVHSYTLTREPTGDLYKSLLDYAVRKCTAALLIVRPNLGLGPRGVELLRRLEPFLRTECETSEWPGTKLFGGYAYAYWYNLDLQCASVLKDTADSLYSWEQPDLPEDLCLLRANDTPWLVTISHEWDSYLSLSDAELTELIELLPELANILRSDDFG